MLCLYRASLASQDSQVAVAAGQAYPIEVFTERDGKLARSIEGSADVTDSQPVCLLKFVTYALPQIALGIGVQVKGAAQMLQLTLDDGEVNDLANCGFGDAVLLGEFDRRRWLERR